MSHQKLGGQQSESHQIVAMWKRRTKPPTSRHSSDEDFQFNPIERMINNFMHLCFSSHTLIVIQHQLEHFPEEGMLARFLTGLIDTMGRILFVNAFANSLQASQPPIPVPKIYGWQWEGNGQCLRFSPFERIVQPVIWPTLVPFEKWPANISLGEGGAT